jgi:hypothetical protein
VNIGIDDKFEDRRRNPGPNTWREGQRIGWEGRREEEKSHAPCRRSLNELWVKSETKTPGRSRPIHCPPTRGLPTILFGSLGDSAGEALAKHEDASTSSKGKSTVVSYEEAARTCKERVAQTSHECRCVNQKYSDFDDWSDMGRRERDCLEPYPTIHTNT